MDVETIRALEDVFTDEDKFPDATISTAIAVAQGQLERFCGFAFVPTARTDYLTGTGRRSLKLERSYVTAVTSVSVAGVATTDTTFTSSGVVTLATGFPEGSAVAVTYTHGLTDLPAQLSWAWGQYVRFFLLHARNRIDDRTTSFSDGEMTFSLAQAGPGRPTGIPIVDAILNDLRLPTGFA